MFLYFTVGLDYDKSNLQGKDGLKFIQNIKYIYGVYYSIVTIDIVNCSTYLFKLKP